MTATAHQVKQKISKLFGSIVTPEKLSSPHGTKTVSEAKLMGLVLMRGAGHDPEAAAKAFGYESEKSASNAFLRANTKYSEGGLFKKNVDDIAEVLGISLE